MLCLCTISLPELLRGRACRSGTLRRFRYFFQKLCLIEALIILDSIVSHFQSQRNDLKPGILQINFVK